MNIGIIVVCYNQIDGIRRLVNSIYGAEIPHNPRKLYLFATSKSVLDICGDIASRGKRWIDYEPYGENVGVAKCWNEGLIRAYNDRMDAAIIVNDDCWFSGGDIEKLAMAARAHMDDPIFAITCAGFHHHYNRRELSLGFSCVVIMPWAIEVVGCFDQNLFPAYLEDCDYAYRASLLGLKQTTERTTNVHHLGSATIFSNPMLQMQNHMTHGLNFEYYRRKWGGINEQEVFTVPFNDSRFGLKISPEDRDAPYPGHNRTDQHIVNL